MRSSSRPVIIMIAITVASVSGTAAATTRPTRQPSVSRLTPSTMARATKNFTMNSSIASSMTAAWLMTLVSVTPTGSPACSFASSASKAWPKFQAVPAIRHDHVQHQGRLAGVADQQGRRVLVAAPHRRDVGDAERAAAGDDRRVPDRLQIVERTVQAEEHLRPGGVNRPGRRDRVLLGQRRRTRRRAPRRAWPDGHSRTRRTPAPAARP